MVDTDFGNLIKKALDMYDFQSETYRNYILNGEAQFDSSEILGYYDNENKIWIWGWLLPNSTIESIPLCNNLLNYGLNIDSSLGSTEHYFIKALLLNSRILVDDIIQLDINLAICAYILKDSIKFIYPKKKYLDDNKKKYITYYYLVKNI
jgi:hypothetical protein